jgi:5,10-methylenetetrahydromethanopterin reductase
MRIGIWSGVVASEDGSLSAVIERCRKAEADGFATVWVTHIFGNDAIVTLALAGQVTSRIELGSFVVPTYPRHPAAMAQQALTAGVATNGRFALGIGLSHRMLIEGMFGLDYSKPLRHMREYLSVLMPLLEGQPVQFRGDEYRVAARLAVPGASRPDVIVAALGPQMLALAGRMADGTGTWMCGPKYLEKVIVPTIRSAAGEAGRKAPRIVAAFPIAIATNSETAKAAAAQAFAMYGTLPSYRATLDKEGAPGPSEMAIVGDEATVRAQLRRLAEIGVTDLSAALYPVAGDPDVEGRTYKFLAAIAAGGI